MTNSKGWAAIIGVSAGTGAALAKNLAQNPGYDIFGVHRGHHAESADRLAHEIKNLGRRAVFGEGEGGTAEGAQRFAQAMREAAGPKSLHFFVHSIANASLGQLVLGKDGPLPARKIQKTFDSMCHSFVYWIQELFACDLPAPGARFLSLGNTLGESMVRRCGLVAAAKAALESYTKTLAIELGPLGYRINMLKFPTVITPAVRVVYGENSLPHIQQMHEQMTPAGRMCTPDEVARFVSLLASDACEWINGATIDFTGGMTLNLMDLILHSSGAGPS